MTQPPPDDPPRFIGYGRQSLKRPGEDEASSLSLRAQHDLFMSECERRGWFPLAFIADHDLKGDDPNRPGIHELLDRVRAGGVDGIWVTMLNRFSNDYLFQGLTWRQLKHLGVAHLVSYVEGPVEDEFILGIHGLVSGKRITELRVHLKNAFARRAKDGGFPVGATPLGYVRPHRITATRANGTTYDRQTGTPEIDPADAALVRAIFDRAANGESIRSIATWLALTVPTARGGNWSAGQVRRIVRNPIYCGDVAHNGTVVAQNAAWAIVDRETWDSANARLSRAVVVHKRDRHWLQGLVRHACGQRFYFQPYPRETDEGWYRCRGAQLARPYACTLPRRTIASRSLTVAVRRALALDLAAIRPVSDAVALARELAGGSIALRARADLDKRLAAAEAEHGRMLLRYRKGKLTEDAMDAEDDALDTERVAVAAAIAALPQSPDLDAIAGTGALFATLADALPAMTDWELRPILAELGEAVVSEAGVRVQYALDPHGIFVRPSTVPIARWKRQPDG
jgi:DNA invertase Pin-like site-specific DNA recombinase